MGLEETRLFATDGSGRALALELDDGALAWRASAPGRVIHCDDEVVLVAHVQRGRMVARLLDAATGRPRAAHVVTLPEWAGEGDVDVEGWRERDGYGLGWHAFTHWDGGYPPTEEERRQARREARGASVVRAGAAPRSVRGPPEWSTPPLPASLQGRRQAHVTWDGRHAHHLGDEGEHTRVVRRSDGATVASLPGVSTHAGVLYVTAAGPIVHVAIEREHVEGDDFVMQNVRVFDRSGAERWRRQLWREPEPDPMP